MVTHGLSYLPYVDYIIVLKDGSIYESGTYQELLDHDGALADLIQNYVHEKETSSTSHKKSGKIFLTSMT